MNQYYVLRLDIPMQYFELVHKIDGVKQVTYDEGGRFFGQGGAIGYHVIELAVRTEL
jgi:hypothetical protein